MAITGTPRTARIALVAALGAVALLVPLQSAAQEPSLAFEVRATGYPVQEPTLGIRPDGVVFYQAREKTLRSHDDGLTWSVAHAPVSGGASFDPFLHVDDATGHVIASQLLAACQVLSVSANGTDFTDTSTCATVDHQKLGSGPWADPHGRLFSRSVYTCSNRVVDTVCAVSPDGGITFGPLVPVFLGADPGNDQGLNADALGVGGVCGGLLGDPTSGPDGTLYVPREFCGRPYLGVSADDGLTWERRAVGGPDAQARPIAYGANNPSVHAATDGTLSYAWTSDDWRHYVSHSTDKGLTWSAPHAVSPPEVRSTTFPQIIAGRPGAVATAFIGSTSAGGPDGTPSTATWHLYISITEDATAPVPTWTTLRVTDDPIQIGCVGRHGSQCRNGNLLDFNDIALTPDGRVAVSFTDGCHPATCTNATTSIAANGMLAIQSAGPRLR